MVIESVVTDPSGIQIFNEWDNFLSIKSNLIVNDAYVIQKYIERPLLINGRKFDIRQFVLVLSLHPLVVFLYNEPYFRLTADKFTTGNLSDP